MSSKQLSMLALALLACRPEASTRSPESSTPALSTDAETAAVGEVREPPTHLLLPWDTALLTAPDPDAPALQLGVARDDSLGRAVAVVGREGEFWQVETLDASGLAGFEALPIEGLDLYRLRLYVPIDVGDPLRPIPPGPDTPGADATGEPEPPLDARAAAIADAKAFGMIGLLTMSSNPPVQTGEPRPAESTYDFRVAPATAVFWPDGREAGEVRHEHAFVEPGAPRSTDAGELRCFAIRVGVVLEPDDGELCFAAPSVQQVAFVPDPHESISGLWGDASFTGELDDDMIGGLIGADIGDVWAEGGLGMTGSGIGGGGGGGGGGAGDIAIAGGIGGLGSSGSTTTIATLAASGLDEEVGRRIVGAQVRELDACWASHAGDGKQREVQLSLEIDAAGNVSSSKAKPKSKRTELAACIEAASVTWLFPTASEATLVVRISF